MLFVSLVITIFFKIIVALSFVLNFLKVTVYLKGNRLFCDKIFTKILLFCKQAKILQKNLEKGDTIKYYGQSYLKILKRNFMLLIMAFVLLILTFFIWAGIPVFIIGGAVSNIISNPIFILLCISVSGGFLFSLYFLPINFKFAEHIANTKGYNSLKYLIRIQLMFISLCTLGFGAIYSILVW